MKRANDESEFWKGGKHMYADVRNYLLKNKAKT